jgi:hypothetical protein
MSYFKDLEHYNNRNVNYCRGENPQFILHGPQI